MRSIKKGQEPNVLSANKDTWLQAYIDDKKNGTKKYRYRHADIKEALKSETNAKCVYCESSIGQNTPGDIEHIIPSSKNENLHFTWSNLTIACTECNRRKNDYYIEGEEFLNPYVEEVEQLLVHMGPIVSWEANNSRAEISVRTLELNSYQRKELIANKIVSIGDFDNLLERYSSETNPTLKRLLWKQIEVKISKPSEYSAMLKSVLEAKGIQEEK